MVLSRASSPPGSAPRGAGDPPWRTLRSLRWHPDQRPTAVGARAPRRQQRPIVVTAAAPEVDLAPKVFDVDDLSGVLRRVPRRPRGHRSTSSRTRSPRSSARPAAARPPCLRCLNRMNDLIPGSPGRGHGAISRASTSTRPDVSPSEVRRRIGMVFQKPNPFPKSIYDNVAFGPRVNGVKKKSQLDDIVEKSAARRRAVGRGEGPAQELGARHVGRSAAAALHRPRDRRRARGRS